MAKKKVYKKYGVFTEAEFEILINAALRGSEGETDKKLYKYYKWATMARVNHVILEQILKGNTAVKIGRDGSPDFKKSLIFPEKQDDDHE